MVQTCPQELVVGFAHMVVWKRVLYQHFNNALASYISIERAFRASLNYSLGTLAQKPMNPYMEDLTPMKPITKGFNVSSLMPHDLQTLRGVYKFHVSFQFSATCMWWHIFTSNLHVFVIIVIQSVPKLLVLTAYSSML